MVVRERFGLGELVERTGIPAPTIHHYVRRGLLPRPRRVSSNRFAYDRRHEHALLLIRVLRERRRLPLSVIRRVLPELLRLEQEQAFRPDMWDELVGAHLARTGRRTPRARLLAAATETFAKRGYGDVNVDEIAAAAGIAKGSLYRHFRSKEELFFAAAESASEEVLRTFARASASGPIPERSAAATLARSLEPHLPIFMDLFTRATQRRPGYARAARRIFSEMAVGVGEQMAAEKPLETGARLLQQAASSLFTRVLAPSPLVPEATAGSTA
jgi:AcrR family transcriptional regulator